MIYTLNIVNKTFLNRFYSSTGTLTIENIFKHNFIGKNIQIKGWVKSLRKMKQNTFVDINDGSCGKNLQIVLDTQMPSLTTGSSVIVSGTLKESPKGQLELKSDSMEICGSCVVDDGYPFAPRKTYATDYIRQYLHFRPRTSKFASLLRVRDAATTAIHNYFHREGYVHIDTPILTSNDCEGAGETFTVLPDNAHSLKSMMKPGVAPEEAYFNSKAFLTVSGQLHLEAAVHSLSKVYTLGPTFRAENSKSRLHLSEFYMLEAESAFVDKLEQVMEIIETMLKSVTTEILNEHEEDIAKCQEEKVGFEWLDKNFVVLSYTEAASILSNKAAFVNNTSLTKEHEKLLVDHCGGIPTFVVSWPKSLKPFYMRDCVDDDSKVSALDLLVSNVGEIAGGSLRENSYDILKEKLPKGNTNLQWYLDLRKFGSVPTGGFGLGFERYLQHVLGISNIKDAIPFPRWPHNCKL